MKKILVLMVLSITLAAFNIDYNLYIGWNLISIPATIDADSVEEIFPLIPPAYAYNSETMSYFGIDGLPDLTSGIWILVAADTLISLPAESPWPVDSSLLPDPPDPTEGRCGMIVGQNFDSTIVPIDRGDGTTIVTLIPDSMSAIAETYLGIVAVDDDLNTEWCRQYNIRGPLAAARAEDNGLFVMGTAHGSEVNIALISIDSTGSPIWGRQFTPPSAMFDYSVATLSDGSHVFLISNKIIRFSDEGVVLWVKQISIDGKEIHTRTGGGFFVYGVDDSYASGDARILAAFDSDGDVLFSKALDASGSERYNAFCFAPSGRIYLAGKEYSTPTGNGKLVALSSAGAMLWSISIEPVPGPDIIEYSFSNIAEHPDGQIALTGKIGTDILGVHVGDDGEYLGAFRYIASFFGSDELENPRYVGSKGEGFQIIGRRGNPGSSHSIISIETESDLSACASYPVELLTGHSDFSPEDYDLTVTESSMTLMPLDIESIEKRAVGFFFCR